MTITIGNVAQFILACLLALVMVGVAYSFAFMGAFADGAARLACFAVAVGVVVCAVLVVMAGGSWL